MWSRVAAPLAARQCAAAAAGALLAAIGGACCPAATRQGAITGPPAASRRDERNDRTPRGGALHRDTRAVLVAAGIDPDTLPCNSAVRWISGLKGRARGAAEEIATRWQVEPSEERRRVAARVIVGYFVRVLYEDLQEQNLGAMRLRGFSYRDTSGRQRPVLVFRSAVLADWDRPEGCLAALTRHAGVAHVVNLYAGTFPLRDLIAREKAFAKRLGATHHDEGGDDKRSWRGLIEEPGDYVANRQLAMERVATLIREQILAPQGAPPRGSIYLHCGGGMHRSGIVFGILRRCINRDPMTLIEAEYRRHTAYRLPAEPGGYEPLNVRFIREFDCALLGERWR